MSRFPIERRESKFIGAFMSIIWRPHILLFAMSNINTFTHQKIILILLIFENDNPNKCHHKIPKKQLVQCFNLYRLHSILLLMKPLGVSNLFKEVVLFFFSFFNTVTLTLFHSIGWSYIKHQKIRRKKSPFSHKYIL